MGRRTVIVRGARNHGAPSLPLASSLRLESFLQPWQSRCPDLCLILVKLVNLTRHVLVSCSSSESEAFGAQLMSLYT